MHRAKLLTGFLVLALMITPTVACGLIEAGGIGISEIGTCRAVSDRTNTPVDITNAFSSKDDRRVVLYFYLDTELDVRFEYRWYHENELVYSHTASQNNENGYNFAWLGAKEGEQLPVGDYRVDVVRKGMVIRSSEFRVDE